MTFYPVKIKDVSSPYEKPMYAFGIYVENASAIEYAYESQSAYDLGKKLGRVEKIKKNTHFSFNYTPPLHSDVSIAESSGQIIGYRIYEMSEQGKEEFIKGLKDALSGKR